MRRLSQITRCWHVGYGLLRVLLLACAAPILASAAPVLKETYPRLMGMNISAKNYGDPVYAMHLAKLDAVILSFYPGWRERNTADPIGDAVRAIKRRNPRILIGQYTVLNETYEIDRWLTERDKAAKLDAEGWWLRSADGKKVQWTDRFDTWETNSTEWTRPDAAGRRYPQWLAERDHRTFFGPVPEFDIWYLDNTNATSPVARADWDLDGRDDDSSDPRISAAIRRGQRLYWDTAKTLAPNVILMGNVGVSNDLSSAEHRGRLGGAFLEGMMGFHWSFERHHGWAAMMDRYLAVLANTAAPQLVGFQVAGRRDDYRQMRYGLTSCLLGDGYFSYSDVSGEYSGVWWFDEYDVQLGKAVAMPPRRAWQGAVYRRDFEYGAVLVNPSNSSQSVNMEPGFRHIQGRQDSIVNSGRAAAAVTLQPKDGVILVRTAVN